MQKSKISRSDMMKTKEKGIRFTLFPVRSLSVRRFVRRDEKGLWALGSLFSVLSLLYLIFYQVHPVAVIILIIACPLAAWRTGVIINGIDKTVTSWRGFNFLGLFELQLESSTFACDKNTSIHVSRDTQCDRGQKIEFFTVQIHLSQFHSILRSSHSEVEVIKIAENLAKILEIRVVDRSVDSPTTRSADELNLSLKERLHSTKANRTSSDEATNQVMRSKIEVEKALREFATFPRIKLHTHRIDILPKTWKYLSDGNFYWVLLSLFFIGAGFFTVVLCFYPEPPPFDQSRRQLTDHFNRVITFACLSFFVPYLLLFNWLFEIKHRISFEKDFIRVTRYKPLGWITHSLPISEIEDVEIGERDFKSALRLRSDRKTAWVGTGLDKKDLNFIREEIIRRIRSSTNETPCPK